MKVIRESLKQHFCISLLEDYKTNLIYLIWPWNKKTHFHSFMSGKMHQINENNDVNKYKRQATQLVLGFKLYCFFFNFFVCIRTCSSQSPVLLCLMSNWTYLSVPGSKHHTSASASTQGSIIKTRDYMLMTVTMASYDT